MSDTFASVMGPPEGTWSTCTTTLSTLQVTSKGSPLPSVTCAIRVSVDPPGAVQPSTMMGSGQATVGRTLLTTVILFEHSVCWPGLSVTEKITMWAPAWPAVGVQLKTVEVPEAGPVKGSGGVSVAPGGIPPLWSVTRSPGSASVPVNVKVKGCPAIAV